MVQYINMKELFLFSTIKADLLTDVIIRCRKKINIKILYRHRLDLFGVLPGITGTYMANEVIKIITETGEVLAVRYC